MKGRNEPTAFLTLSPRIGGQEKGNYPSIGQYLTKEQANFVYKKTESGEIIHTETIQQELECEKHLGKIYDTSRDPNLYKEVIVNNTERLETVSMQMEQWSILSNTLNYIGHDKLPQNFHSLDISTVEFYKNNSSMAEENVIEIDFGPTPDVSMEEYLDVHEGIHSEIVDSTRFDENPDLSTTHLGKSNRSKNDKFKVEESFPISKHGFATGKVLDGTECQLHLDTGTSKSFMSKSFYMHCKSLHALPKFASKTQRI